MFANTWNIRRSLLALGPCILPGLLIQAGCSTVDPKADVDRAGQLVSERTGSSSFYDPQADDLASQKVDDLLADGLTTAEAVEVALLNNHGFQAMFAEIGVSHADVVQSTLLSNPTISLAFAFPEGGGRSKFNVGIGQQIVDLWQIPVRKKIAEAQLEETILQIARRAVELAAEVKTVCYRLLALEKVLQVTHQNHNLARQSLDLVQQQYDAGQATQLDVNLARISVLDVEAELIRLEQQRDVTRATLGRLLGVERQGRSWQLVDKLPLPDAIPAEVTLCQAGLRQRLDGEIMIHRIRAAEEQVRLEILKVFPNLTLGFELERSEDRSLPGRHLLADTARDSIAAGQLTAPSIQSRAQRAEEKRQVIDAVLGPSLEITLPIFDQNQAQIAKARFTLQQETKRFEELLDEVFDQVQEASRTSRSNLRLLHFYEHQLLPQLETTVAMSRQIYQAGQQSVLTLLDAQRSLLARRTAYVNVLRDYAVAIAELERAVGGRIPGTTTSAPASAPAAGGPAGS